jgi:UDP-N-acetylmuramoylalanine--D-glutamate ligase
VTQRLIEGHVGVWGAGRSGVGIARLLSDSGYDVTLYDDRSTQALCDQLGEVPFQVVGGGLSFQDHSLIVLSPGIPPHSDSIKALIASDISFMSEVEAALAMTQVPVIAVTGTDGKSTTSAMIDHVLNHAGHKSVVCGNFGVPVSEVLSSEDSLVYLVVEISAFQLWSTQRFEPKVAVITNIAQDHLDYFEGDFERYRAAKLRVFQDMLDGQVVLRRDGYETYATQVPTSVNVTAFDAKSELAPWSFSNGQLMYEGTGFLAYDALRVVGLHNVNNALSTAAALHHLGIGLVDIAAGLSTFTGLPHRMEYVRTVSEVDFYNDSKATNPHAARAGIEAMNGSLIVIAGGYDKGLDLRGFAHVLRKSTYAVLTGPAGRNLFELLQPDSRCVWVDSMNDAVTEAMRVARPGDTVVLAPGSSSFDAFKSFEHRGDEFKRLVRLL